MFSIIIRIFKIIYLLIIRTTKAVFCLIKKIIRYINKAVTKIAVLIYSLFIPVEDKVLFLTYQGDYTCNPQAIAEELLAQKVDFPLVWCVKNNIPNSDYPLELRFVKYGTHSFYREIASSRIIIENTNIVERLGIAKKKNQYLLQTWHGSLGIKRLDGDVVMGAKWKYLSKKCQKYVDYCLSNSTFETEVFNTSYWKNVPVLLTGHARNDIFFIRDIDRINKIKKKVFNTLNISEDKKIFLYAPTHRDNIDENIDELDYEKLKLALEIRFGGKWQIVIRLHNRLRKKLNKSFVNLPSYVTNATMYENMQEILLCTDVGVTDYSSWIFDYVLTKKPGFILNNGLKVFESQRGFYYPLNETPFSISDNCDELITAIKDFNEKEYIIKVDDFLKARGCIDDGHASERIVDKIKELIIT